MGYSQNSTTVVGVIWNSQGLGVWNKGHKGSYSQKKDDLASLVPGGSEYIISTYSE